MTLTSCFDLKDSPDVTLEKAVEETAAFVRELFETFVDGPIQTPDQAKIQASRIALSVVEASSPIVHLAYTEVANGRRVKGLPMGA